MQLHTIFVKTTRHKRRIGRGGKRGTTSGRGTKGQKSRAGRKIRPEIRDLIQRIPKRRGVGFSGSGIKVFALRLEVIAEAFRDGEKVTPRTLAKHGFVRLPKGNGKTVRIKILGGGRPKKLIFENVNVSRRAAEAIITAGGEIRNIKHGTT